MHAIHVETMMMMMMQDDEQKLKERLLKLLKYREVKMDQKKAYALKRWEKKRRQQRMRDWKMKMKEEMKGNRKMRELSSWSGIEELGVAFDVTILQGYYSTGLNLLSKFFCLTISRKMESEIIDY